jgi:DNA modification methylase
MPGLPPIRIAGCESGCVHEWVSQLIAPKHGDDGVTGSTLGGGKATQAQSQRQPVTMGYCSKCGGWRGGLGNEPTLEAYIGHLVLCLREWRRVLRDDGICFVNLGDSFSGSGGAGGDYNEGGLRAGQPKFKAGKSNGLKPKDLMMVPARFALAAQADGWWLRSDIIGHKIAPMPESVTDRPTRSHEHIFMLTKSARYYWDGEAVRDEAAPSSLARIQQPTFDEQTGGPKDYRNGINPNRSARQALENFAKNPGRNMRDVIEWREPMYRLRSDLTFEQRAYVLGRIAAVDSHSQGSTDANNI